MELSIRRNHEAAVSKSGADEVYIVFADEYEEGDEIVFNPDSAGYYLLDLGLGKNILYSDGNIFTFPIPFGEKRFPYNPESFGGALHYLYARRAFDFELSYRNVSENVYDWHGNSTMFPHSKANIETRGESVFASRNAFDGVVASSGHGKWPYESWGINRDPNAELSLDFGREVTIDRIVFYTRADFPHDAWWDNATIAFSDGSELEFPLEKKDGAQTFEIEPRKVSSLVLKELIKSYDPSPFPALIQLMAFGE